MAHIRNTASALMLSSIIAVSTPALAEGVDQISVSLKRLQQVLQQEKAGDELYISVTEFTENERPKFYQIPRFPAHWTSENIGSIKDVVLWKKAMKTCTPTRVIFSLVEEDLPPWNTNDLVGSMQLEVSCEKGKMKTSWHIPNAANTAVIADKNHAFEFTGNRANYRAYLNVIKNKVPVKNLQKQQEQPIQIRERVIFP